LKSKAKKRQGAVEQYTHGGKKRPNNPPVGLVTPGTDPDQPSKEYSHDPRSDPQLVWSGKQENSEFKVDTVSLHVHERIDPHTILEKAMKSEQATQQNLFRYFETPENNPPIRDAIEFYRHDQNWSNRLIAGDSLLVMNSLLEKEGMGGKVQMIYIDPPYGIKYGSNFQPFVNKKNVQDGKDEDLTQEPEMIRAFRDTWELGIHSYLSYLRDRLFLAKELLTESGSVFVQISDENQHHVREIMDEVFGSKNFVSLIMVKKATRATSKTLASISDYLCWYAKDRTQIKYRDLYIKKDLPTEDINYRYLEMKDGTRRPMTSSELSNPNTIPKVVKIFAYQPLTSQSGDASTKFEFNGKIFTPDRGSWRTSINGLKALALKNRIASRGNTLKYVTYFDDFPHASLSNVWTDTTSAFAKRLYVVQTIPKIIERAVLMTTDPGDLVFDPTCGGGTTAFVSEKWGRR